MRYFFFLLLFVSTLNAVVILEDEEEDEFITDNANSAFVETFEEPEDSEDYSEDATQDEVREYVATLKKHHIKHSNRFDNVLFVPDNFNLFTDYYEGETKRYAKLLFKSMGMVSSQSKKLYNRIKNQNFRTLNVVAKPGIYGSNKALTYKASFKDTMRKVAGIEPFYDNLSEYEDEFLDAYCQANDASAIFLIRVDSDFDYMYDDLNDKKKAMLVIEIIYHQPNKGQVSDLMELELFKKGKQFHIERKALSKIVASLQSNIDGTLQSAQALSEDF